MVHVWVGILKCLIICGYLFFIFAVICTMPKCFLYMKCPTVLFLQI